MHEYFRYKLVLEIDGRLGGESRHSVSLEFSGAVDEFSVAGWQFARRPHEWSCRYRRNHLAKCFRDTENSFGAVFRAFFRIVPRFAGTPPHPLSSAVGPK